MRALTKIIYIKHIVIFENLTFRKFPAIWYTLHVCVVKLKHTNWCNANLLSLMVLCLNPISFNTLLSDVLPPEETPSFRSFDCRWSNKVKGLSIQNSPTKIFDSDRFSFLSYNEFIFCLSFSWHRKPTFFAVLHPRSYNR